MEERPTKLIIDLSAPEGERESVVYLTDEEMAQREVDMARALEEEAARKAEEEARQQAKASLESKLSSLGITVDELKLLGL